MACSMQMLRSRPLSHLAGQQIAQPLLPARHRPTRAAPGWESLPSTSSRSSRLTPGPLGGGFQRTGLRPQQPTSHPIGLRPQQPRAPPREQVVTHAKDDAMPEDEDEVKKGWKFGRNEGNMPWPWKLCAAILYMLPWVDVTEKTVYFIERFPALVWTEFFTEPFEHWFYIHEWAPLIIFFGTYLGIVRNKKIPHVARYHIMMGVMLDIVAMILIVVEENLPFGVLWTPWSDLFYACMFWFVFLLVIYCLFFCFMGWYCEIPLISEGVYIQIEQAESMG